MTRKTGRRIAVAVLVGALGLSALAGTAYGVLTLTGMTEASSRAYAKPAPRSQSPAPAPQTRAPKPEITAKPEPKPEPKPVLEPGDHGVQVRELQARLTQIAWFTPPMTGDYDTVTRAAVGGFQVKRGFHRTGVVDKRTWRRLVAMTHAPTDAELFNRAGPALFEPGDSGAQVREIQARLRQIGWFFGDVSDQYGDQTREAVTGFQGKRGIPQTGKVDQRTLDLLEGMTVEPTADSLANKAPDPAEGAPLDARCLTGAALCIDKSSNSLRYVIDGKVTMTVDVRFGSAELPTREGQFSVFMKSRDHVSSLYDTSMPLAMFFSGGQAVHYSPDFAANGYNGASHGCVNVRDYAAISSLFDQVAVGTKVIVYRS